MTRALSSMEIVTDKVASKLTKGKTYKANYIEDLILSEVDDPDYIDQVVDNLTRSGYKIVESRAGELLSLGNTKSDSLLESWSVITPGTKYGYIGKDGKAITDYNNAGLFKIRKAAEIINEIPNSLLQADPSGDWLIVVLDKDIAGDVNK